MANPLNPLGLNPSAQASANRGGQQESSRHRGPKNQLVPSAEKAWSIPPNSPQTMSPFPLPQQGGRYTPNLSPNSSEGQSSSDHFLAAGPEQEVPPSKTVPGLVPKGVCAPPKRDGSMQGSSFFAPTLPTQAAPPESNLPFSSSILQYYQQQQQRQQPAQVSNPTHPGGALGVKTSPVSKPTESQGFRK